MQLQVEQLEKEKKELNERMRILSKRIDHIERAYRKEERPLLAKDYEIQQANDRAVFEEMQKERIEAHRQAHLQDLETKKRLARMVVDFNQMKATIAARRGEEFAKKQETAQRKMEEEKAKRRATILKEREEERLFQEEQERKRREQEEEAARLEAGISIGPLVVSRGVDSPVFPERLAEERRKAEEEAAAEALAEQKKREEEERREALRKQREEERLQALESTRRQQQREEEAMRRQAERKAQAAAQAQAAPPSRPGPFARATESDAWRRSGPPSTPPRSESPAPVASKYRPPGALGAGAAPAGGGWRARMAAKEQGGAAGDATPARAASPAVPPPPQEEAPKDSDGFQTVEKKVWRGSRLQARKGV